MKNWVTILIIVILAIASITSSVLYLQEKGNINSIQSQISVMKTDITTVKGSVTQLPQNGAAPTTSSPAVNPPVSTSTGVPNVVANIGPSVVRVDVAGRGFQASGSGFIVDSRGYILTNQHVIDSSTTINVTLKSGQQSTATVTDSDKNLDLAILKLNSNIANLQAVTLGSVSDIIIGEDAIAAGFPLGTDLPGPVSFTKGIVSALRTMGGASYVQTDVTINPGNSGGCLVTLNSKVIGITTAGVVPQGLDAENIGLAIPVDVAKTFMQGKLK